MRKIAVLVILITIVFNLFSDDISKYTELAMINNKFAINLYTKMKDEKENLFFSPYSILNAFSMVYIGADGETKQEIKSSLNINLSDNIINKSHKEYLDSISKLNESDNIVLNIQNSFWPSNNYTFLESYINTINDFYNTQIYPTDYKQDSIKATDDINNWTSDNTNGLIPKILEFPLTDHIKWLIVNTIYFKSTWVSIFKEEETQKRAFLVNNDEIQVDTMFQSNAFEIGYFDDLKSIKLPYSNKSLSMYILLPHETNGLMNIEKQLSVEDIDKWTSELYFSDAELYLPKFKYTYNLKKIKTYFYELGIEKVFNKNESDLSRIDGKKKNLYIDLFKHNAAIEVNEKGSEAAAATALGCFPKGTLIHVENGLKAIEELEPGDKIKSYNMITEQWEITNLISKDSFYYGADMVKLKINNQELICTGTQPVYVVKGKNLGKRPKPEEFYDYQNENEGVGKWVEARDLEKGDYLISYEEGIIELEKISTYNTKEEVFHLTVDKNHNHAFHELGILVHNNNNKESAVELFDINHPFLYIIKDENNGLILFMGRVNNPLL